MREKILTGLNGCLPEPGGQALSCEDCPYSGTCLDKEPELISLPAEMVDDILAFLRGDGNDG